jgi:hypothetical protein
MSKYDELRKNLFYVDYDSLKAKVDSSNPFLSVPTLTKNEAQKLYVFLHPPTRKSFLQDRRKRNSNGQRKKKKYTPHTLIFIIDALTKLKNTYYDLQLYTDFAEKNSIHPDLIELQEIANKAIPYFQKLAETHPTLSFQRYINALRKALPGIDSPESDKQVKKAIRGIHTTHPRYSCFIQPLVENPNKKKQESLIKHQLINGIIWNTYLHNCYHLSAHQTIEQALRSIEEADLINLKNFSELSSHHDLVSLLTIHGSDKFKEIISFLNRLDRVEKSSPSENRKNKSTKKHEPHQHNYWIETDANTQIIHVGEEEDGLLIIRKHPSLESEELEDLADDELIENEFIQEIRGEETSVPEAKVVNLAQKLNHLANFNQFLKDELTPTEVNAILKYADKKSLQKSTTESELRSLMLLLVSLASGYNLHQSHYLRWFKVNPTPNSQIVCISENCDTLFIPIPRYEYLKLLNETNQNLYYTADRLITLPLPPQIQKILFNCLESYYQNKDKAQDAASEKNKKKSVKNALKRTLDNIGLDKRLTITLIQNHTPFKALKYANGDLWTISLFSGREDIMSSTHKHYTTIDVFHALKVYQKTVAEVFGFCPFIDKPQPQKSYVAIGNPLRPQKHHVVSWLNRVSKVLSNSVNSDPKTIPTETLVQNMNLITGYFETFLSFFIATRNTTNPYIYQNQMLSNGFVTLNDKNTNNGYNTHFVCVPFQIRTLQLQYESWIWKAIRVLRSRKLLNIEELFSEKLQTVHKWKALHTENTRFPGFFLLEYLTKPTPKETKLKIFLKLRPYTRGNLHKTLEQQLPQLAPPLSFFENNINRHFLRSSLLERGVNPEYIDEYMGHRHWGTESWNRFGIFNPLDYQEEIKQAIEKVMKDFKVSSPFKEKK